MSDSRLADVFPLVEEELRIDKQTVVTGKVRVRSVVETIEEVARATLEGEHVEVTCVPIGREIEAVPQVRSEDGTVIVPVVEEIMVVEKRLVLKGSCISGASRPRRPYRTPSAAPRSRTSAAGRSARRTASSAEPGR